MSYTTTMACFALSEPVCPSAAPSAACKHAESLGLDETIRTYHINLVKIADLLDLAFELDARLRGHRVRDLVLDRRVGRLLGRAADWLVLFCSVSRRPWQRVPLSLADIVAGMVRKE